MDDMMAMPPEYMEQRIAGTQNDMANYVSECKRELKSCMLQTYIKTAKSAYEGHSGVLQDITQEAVNCFEQYFNSMKGATNLSEADVIQSVKGEFERHRRFYGRLIELAGKFTWREIGVEILEPGNIYSDPMWDMGICVGTSIRIDSKAYLYATPICAAKTYDYMALRQDPVAAQIIYMDDSLIFFAQHDQDLGDTFWQAYRELFDAPQDVKADFPNAWAAVVAGNALLIDAKDALGDTELEKLMVSYAVAGVIMANSSTFVASLYVGQRQLSKLEYEVAGLY
jgi:hypothetical protein